MQVRSPIQSRYRMPQQITFSVASLVDIVIVVIISFYFSFHSKDNERETHKHTQQTICERLCDVEKYVIFTSHHWMQSHFCFSFRSYGVQLKRKMKKNENNSKQHESIILYMIVFFCARCANILIQSAIYDTFRTVTFVYLLTLHGWLYVVCVQCVCMYVCTM